ncbi:MAG: hypothetical protein Q4C95_06105 [Planctomycetia bacterium]|nr:hypothetical protein [Planctomycetia bacterium]
MNDNGSPLISGLFHRFSSKKEDEFVLFDHDNELTADELLTNDPDDELLVAYLDNELNDQERETFQKRLEQSEIFRKKLEELKSTWNMLDELEQTSLDPKITQSTLKMVAVDVENQLLIQKKHNRWLFIQRGILICIFLFLTFCLGNWTVSMFVPDQMEQLKKDVPLLILLDQLEIVSDFDFLVQLKESGYFALPFSEVIHSESSNHYASLSSQDDFTQKDEMALSDKNQMDSPRQNHSIPQSADNQWAKFQTIQNTDSSLLLQDRDFFRKQQNFYRLTSKEQNKIRSLYRHIILSPDSEELFNILNHYNDWFRAELHEIQRDQILSIPSKKRFDLVERCYNETKNKKRSQSYFRSEEKLFDKISNASNHLNSSSNIDSFYPCQNNFYQASRNRNMIQELKKKIPIELRNENIDFLGDLFENYMETLKKRGPFPNIDQIYEPRRIFEMFLLENSLKDIILQFSSPGQEYFNQLPEEEQKRMIDLLLKINLFERARKTNFANRNERVENDFMFNRVPKNKRNDPTHFKEDWANHLNPEDRKKMDNLANSDPVRNFDSFKPQEMPFFLSPIPNASGKDFNSRNMFGRGDAAGFFWKNESTQELAETLRNLPQERKDELLSLPSDEMYTRLLMIHWGFGGSKEFNRFDNPAPPMEKKIPRGKPL